MIKDDDRTRIPLEEALNTVREALTIPTIRIMSGTIHAPNERLRIADPHTLFTKLQGEILMMKAMPRRKGSVQGAGHVGKGQGEDKSQDDFPFEVLSSDIQDDEDLDWEEVDGLSELTLKDLEKVKPPPDLVDSFVETQEKGKGKGEEKEKKEKGEGKK